MIGKLTAWKPLLTPVCRHCEERSDEAIHLSPYRDMDCFAALAMTNERLASGLRLVAEIRLDRAMHLDRQRVAVAVLGIARGDAHPALADAIFLHIGFLDTLEANADIAR